ERLATVVGDRYSIQVSSWCEEQQRRLRVVEPDGDVVSGDGDRGFALRCLIGLVGVLAGVVDPDVKLPASGGSPFGRCRGGLRLGEVDPFRVWGHPVITTCHRLERDTGTHTERLSCARLEDLLGDLLFGWWCTFGGRRMACGSGQHERRHKQGNQTYSAC